MLLCFLPFFSYISSHIPIFLKSKEPLCDTVSKAALPPHHPQPAPGTHGAHPSGCNVPRPARRSSRFSSPTYGPTAALPVTACMRLRHLALDLKILHRGSRYPPSLPRRHRVQLRQVHIACPHPVPRDNQHVVNPRTRTQQSSCVTQYLTRETREEARRTKDNLYNTRRSQSTTHPHDQPTYMSPRSQPD